MIDRKHDLPITKQAEVLRISRGSVYYLPRPVSAADLAIMRRLDRLHLEFPFAGARMLQGLLSADGCKIGRRHVKTLMRRMGIEALYRRPRTTKPEPGHKIFPYLLRGIEITRAKSGVGDGHHLHPDGAWPRLPGGRARLVQPARAVVARIDHDGSGVLRRDIGGCLGSSRQAGHLQHRPRARSSPVRPSPAYLPTTALRSAWTARVPGGTTSSSSGCGAASNTRRCICGPTTASARPAHRSADTSTSTIAHRNTHLAM